MNSTMHTDPGLRQAVDAYAAAVRRHLVDLRPDQVDDLTDGLEADLIDALSDIPVVSGAERAAVDPSAQFGEPGAYARELRVAAGLSASAEDTGSRSWPGPVAAAGRGVLRGVAVVRRQPWASALARLADDLRPLWWAARAWVVYQAIMWTSAELNWWPRSLLPERDGVPGLARHWALLGVLVTISVQWGRGRWGAVQLPRLSRVLTVITLVLLVPVAVFTSEARFYGVASGSVQYVEVPVDRVVQPDDGVWVDGMQVSNLFVYDAKGDPLTDVQVYDDRGRPVRTTVDQGWSSWALPGVSETWNFVPSQDEDGRDRWNVYPLRGAPTEEFDWDKAADGASGSERIRSLLVGDPRLPPLPFAQAPALVEPDAGATEQDAAAPQG